MEEAKNPLVEISETESRNQQINRDQIRFETTMQSESRQKLSPRQSPQEEEKKTETPERGSEYYQMLHGSPLVVKQSEERKEAKMDIIDI